MKNYYRIIESRNHYKLQVKQFPYFVWRTLLEGTDFQFISGASDYYKKTFPKGRTYNIVK
jgi:hypothetical protein